MWLGRREGRITLGVASAVLALLSPLPARAQTQERDPAAAQALFDQARQLIQQGKVREACPKLLESNRLDPGIGTQFYLADCYERSGKLASAWATFLDVASIAHASNQLDREKAAAKRAAQLEPRLPKLIVTVPESSLVPFMEVRRTPVDAAAEEKHGLAAGSAEGLRILIGAAQWGTPVPVDPGEYVMMISAPGRTPQQKVITLEEGKSSNFQVPALQEENQAAKPPVAAAVVAQPSPPQPAPKPEPEPEPEPRKETPPTTGSHVAVLPLILAGAGVVGLGVGTVFALKAKSSNEDSKQDCGTPNINVCGPQGLASRNDALHQGNVATVSFIAGGAFLASAVIVWRVEAGSKKSGAAQRPTLQARATVAPGNAALYLQGNF